MIELHEDTATNMSCQSILIVPSITNVLQHSIGKNRLSHIYDTILYEWKICIMAVENVLSTFPYF